MMLTVRPATPADLPALEALRRDKLALLAQIDARFAAPAPARWEAWLGDARCLILVAVAEAEPAGYVVGWLQDLPVGTVGLVTDIALDMHRYQRQAARDLLDALKAWFRQHDAQGALVLAARRGALEQTFWRGLGAAEWMDGLWLTL